MQTKTRVISYIITFKTWGIMLTTISNLQKLFSVLAIFTLMIKICKEVYISFATKNSFSLPFAFNIFLFKRILYIYYPLRFKKDQINIQALINSNNEINAMTLVYAANLELKIRPTSIKVLKIDRFTL